MVASKSDFPPVRACLFDMDGLLINTEDLYSQCHNILLAEYSRPPVSWDVKARLQGRPATEAIKILLASVQLPDVEPADYVKRLDVIQAAKFPSAEPLPGVEKLLSDLKTATTATCGGEAATPAQEIHMALATSSTQTKFRLKTSHLGPVFAVFEPRRRVLGDDPRIGRGKPSPDIFLVALAAINETLGAGEAPVRPEECLVFEDSVPGVEAGRRAGMRVVWVPHKGLAVQYKGKEAAVLAGRGEDSQVDVHELGQLGDGWAQQLSTLEDFPYEKYGIVTVS